MTELQKIVLTSSLTILGGISVFVVGQIVSKFLIEPIHEQSKIIGKIADSLIFYANLYSNPGSNIPREESDEASRTIRQQASQLMAKSHAVRWYRLWQFFRVVPRYDDIVEASKNLIGLSNSFRHGEAIQNDKRRREIERLLGIRTHL